MPNSHIPTLYYDSYRAGAIVWGCDHSINRFDLVVHSFKFYQWQIKRKVTFYWHIWQPLHMLVNCQQIWPWPPHLKSNHLDSQFGLYLITWSRVVGIKPCDVRAYDNILIGINLSLCIYFEQTYFPSLRIGVGHSELPYVIYSQVRHSLLSSKVCFYASWYSPGHKPWSASEQTDIASFHPDELWINCMQ